MSHQLDQSLGALISFRGAVIVCCERSSGSAGAGWYIVNPWYVVICHCHLRLTGTVVIIPLPRSESARSQSYLYSTSATGISNPCRWPVASSKIIHALTASDPHRASP